MEIPSVKFMLDRRMIQRPCTNGNLGTWNSLRCCVLGFRVSCFQVKNDVMLAPSWRSSRSFFFNAEVPTHWSKKHLDHSSTPTDEWTKKNTRKDQKTHHLNITPLKKTTWDSPIFFGGGEGTKMELISGLRVHLDQMKISWHGFPWTPDSFRELTRDKPWKWLMKFNPYI